MEPVVDLRSAVSVLGRFPALAGVDLRVEPSEVVHLCGPNGAGKTTLLRVCAGLAPVTADRAVVLGVDLVADRVAVRPLVGFMAQETFLYDDLTVIDNVRFFAKAVGVPVADADAALITVRLESRLAEVAVGRLSTGQRRRVSLAAMIVRRPRLWLLDEPHAGLDADARDLVDGLIAGAVAAGATVLMASHELDRATAVATRQVAIDGGIVAADTSLNDASGNDAPVADSGSKPKFELRAMA